MAKNKSEKNAGLGSSLPKVETPKELVFERLDKIDGFKMAAPGLCGDEKPPEWVMKALSQVMKVHMPGVKINKATVKTPFVMGALMGYQFTMARQMTPERLSILRKLVIEAQTNPLRRADARETERLGNVIFERSVPAITVVAQESLAGALNLPKNEMAEFMGGFEIGSRGASFESFKAHLEFTTLVYSYLVVGWQAVEKLGSVTELRNWLLERLPAIDVGSESRIKKLCLRIGLKLRGRGRPKKAGK